jgi:hypothetical protein
MEIDLFLESCQQHGIQLHAEKGELSYRAQKGAMTEEILTALKNRKAEILHYLTHAADIKTRFLLRSTCQDRALLYDRVIWKDYPTRIMDLGVANGTHIVMRISGEINTDTMLDSIRAIIERHDVLNCTIEISEGNLYLVRRPKQPPCFQEVIIKGETIEQREMEAMRIANDLVWQEYDLDSGPLYRIFLLKLSLTDQILGVGLHHSIGDGFSIGSLFNEIGIFYGSIVTRNPSPLPPVLFQYMDYLNSMEAWLQSPTGDDYIRYWVDHLKSSPETHLLPMDRLPLIRSNAGPASQELIFFNSDVALGLKSLAAQLRTTVFRVLLSAYKAAIGG